MFTTLVAVLVALALGHVAPAAAASLRRFSGFRRWLGWLDAHGGRGWQSAAGVALALLPLLLLMALLQGLLHGALFGLPGLVLGVGVLAWCWGRATWTAMWKR
ncbi:MAG: hypothetical protein GAK31_02598 [Stenotrophomonas maltophilia]|uniref:Transmembrane protein n=1 Tax=Stenotrophomonas maltophilia TaxID=40324 RepID=A0A7V8JLP5_STEMA|nr:MAG: hypothetical protein GAK31_02598 [Stenotrophomonas maltophilia]